MAELSKENLPSTVSPTSTSTKPTVEESIPSREDASREDGKHKSNIIYFPEDCKRMKSVQYVTQPSFEQNESNIGENFGDNNTGSITNNNEVVHKNLGCQLLQ